MTAVSEFHRRIKLEGVTKVIEERRRIYEAENRKRLGGRVYRPIYGVKTSEDFGKTWRLAAVCDECRASIQEPTLRKDLGGTGARSCDWCGARNETMKELSAK